MRSTNLFLLAPKVRERANEAVLECQENGLQIAIFEAWRSFERQAELYAQGRTKPGKIVTRAQPGMSAHNYGLAIDIAYYINGRWDWSGDFDKPTAIFLSHGFEPPPSFERVHFQMTNGLPVSALREIAQRQTVIGLWHELGLV